jgi:hypothetical protein
MVVMAKIKAGSCYFEREIRNIVEWNSSSDPRNGVPATLAHINMIINSVDKEEVMVLSGMGDIKIKHLSEQQEAGEIVMGLGRSKVYAEFRQIK